MSALNSITPESTLQEVRAAIFETIVRGLAAQGWKPSLSSDSRCCWLSSDGKSRCAIGHLLRLPEHGVLVSPNSQTIELARGWLVPELKAWVDAPSVDPVPRWEQFYPIMSVAMSYHDASRSPTERQLAFQEYGEHNGLSWPEELRDE